MASRDAQKSEVHETTDDATTSPASGDAPAARPSGRAGGPAAPQTEARRPGEIEGGVGASDGTSGGGAGAGSADAETVLRTGNTLAGGDVEEDRQKLFPDAAKGAEGETKVSKDPDESSFGGPLRIRDDEAAS